MPNTRDTPMRSGGHSIGLPADTRPPGRLRRRSQRTMQV